MKKFISISLLLISSATFADYLFSDSNNYPQTIYQTIEYSGYGDSCRVSGDVFSLEGYTFFDFGRIMFTCNAVYNGPYEAVTFYKPGSWIARTKEISQYNIKSADGETITISKGCTSVGVISDDKSTEKISDKPACFKGSNNSTYIYFSESLDSFDGQPSDGNRTTIIEIKTFPKSEVLIYIPEYIGTEIIAKKIQGNLIP